ncbi:MAG: MarR family winged helix-turn-helix transcriptional regulator [Planctomycetota bacterium]|jgi:DNA-binding MarR family transcriptional regulator
MASKPHQPDLEPLASFTSPEQEALLNLMRTQSVLSVGFERLIRKYNLTGPQYNILRILRGAKAYGGGGGASGEARGSGVSGGSGGLRSQEIAPRLITAVPDLPRLIDRLEKSGYVERRRCSEDRRVVYNMITDSGRKLLAKLDKPVRDNERATLGHMSKKELAELTRLLTKARLRAAIETEA